MKKIIISQIFLFCCFIIKAQPKVKTSINGQFVITTDAKRMYCNFGGPALSVKFKSNNLFQIGMFPSLRFVKETGQLKATPSLAFGLQFVHKRLIVATPFYYQNNTANWYASFGVGYKF